MTASPAAVSIPPTRMAAFKGATSDNPLAALFAAAAASSMQRKKAVSPTQPKPAPQIESATSTPISSTKIKQKSNGTTPLGASATTKVAPPTKIKATNRESEVSAANLIASLLNKTTRTSLSSPGFASASSLPLTKTTVTITTTNLIKSQPAQQKQPSSPPMKESKSATVVKHKTSLLDPEPEQSSSETMTGTIELRNLESWHDEDEVKMDDDEYQELVDSTNKNGWSADEMFKYNEKRHKVMSSYSEKTLSDKYTTPLSKNKSKTTARMATKLAKEIEDRVEAEGRVTPESSDDDELFERERRQRMQLKTLKQLDQLKNAKSSNGVLQLRNRSSANGKQIIDHRPPINDFSIISCARKSTKSSSQHSNSSATPATASLSSSPIMNETNNTITKSLASSSRNILRTCLT